MAKKGANAGGSNFMFSPAEGLDVMPSPGGGSTPGSPSVFPDFSLTGKGGDAAPGSSFGETFGTPETVSAGGCSGVQIADVTESKAGVSGDLAGGLGNPPKPSGSY